MAVMAELFSARDVGNGFVFYRYHPSLAAATLFTTLFGISTALHIFQAVKFRARFMIPLIIGGFFETAGYICRILSSQDPTAKHSYVGQSLLLLLGPALFAASIYMILGRIIALTDGEAHSLIRRRWLTKLFVAGDALALGMQGGGGGTMATADGNVNQQHIGQDVVVSGLLAQIVSFGVFVAVAVAFQIRAKAHLAALDSVQYPWRKHLFVLYVISMLILVRSVVRVIEFAQGNDGYIMSREVFLYVFDACLMSIVIVCVHAVHPGEIARLLKQRSEVDNVHEMTGAKEGRKVEQRTLAETESGYSCSDELTA